MDLRTLRELLEVLEISQNDQENPMEEKKMCAAIRRDEDSLDIEEQFEEILEEIIVKVSQAAASF